MAILQKGRPVCRRHIEEVWVIREGEEGGRECGCKVEALGEWERGVNKGGKQLAEGPDVLGSMTRMAVLGFGWIGTSSRNEGDKRISSLCVPCLSLSARLRLRAKHLSVLLDKAQVWTCTGNDQESFSATTLTRIRRASIRNRPDVHPSDLSRYRHAATHRNHGALVFQRHEVPYESHVHTLRNSWLVPHPCCNPHPL